MNNNWRMKCIDNNGNPRGYTVGKIYEVVNGRFICDSGGERGLVRCDFKDWQEFSVAEWELVEEEQALEVECYNVDNVVLLKVLHADSNIFNNDFEFITKDQNFTIMTANFVSIYTHILYISQYKSRRIYNRECISCENKEQAEKLVERVHKAVAELNESLADKPKGRWKPNEDEIYWSVDGFNQVDSYVYAPGSIDIERWNKKWNENNVFQTEKEAERKKAIFNKLYELRYEFSLEEWERTDVHKHYIIYNYRDKKLINGFSNTSQTHRFYFKTEEKAKEFIDFCGKEDYVKYVLGAY